MTQRSDIWLFAEAAKARGQILRVLAVPLFKALDPLHPDHFLVLQGQIAKALKGVAAEDEAKALKACFESLDVDWPNASKAQKEAALQAAKNALAQKPLEALPKIEQTFSVSGKKVVEGAKQSAAVRYDLNLSAKFNSTDQKVIDFAAKSSANYARDQYGVRAADLSAKARSIVSAGLEKGFDRYTIGKQLREDITLASANRSNAYWEMVAGVHANRARSWASLSVYEENGIEQYQFEAVLDEVTCFSAGVPVRMADGSSLEIERVVVGDLVRSCKGRPRAVTEVRRFVKKMWCSVYLSSGAMIRVTPNHPLLVSGVGWVQAGALAPGDKLVLESSNLSGMWRDVPDPGVSWRGEEVLLRRVPVSGDDVRDVRSGLPATRCHTREDLFEVVRRDPFDREAGESSSAVRRMREAGPYTIIPLLFAGMLDHPADVRVVSGAVSRGADLRESGPGSVPLHGVPARSLPWRARAGRHSANMRSVWGGVRRVSSGGTLEENPVILLEGVSASSAGNVSHLRRALSPRDREGAEPAVLFPGLLPEVGIRNLNRGCGEVRPGIDASSLSPGSEDWSVVGGLPRGQAGDRGGRGLLALEAVRAGSGCSSGCSPRRDGIPRDALLGSGAEEGLRLRRRSFAGLWPHPAIVETSKADTVRVARVVWDTAEEPAFDLEVEEDKGYIAGGVVVHNTFQCRFLHGRTFSVAVSRQKMLAPEETGDPEEVTRATPWLGVEKDDAGTRHIYYNNPAGGRERVAAVAESAYGQKDNTGKFTTHLSNGELEARGVTCPPVHGNCRSTIVPLTTAYTSAPSASPKQLAIGNLNQIAGGHPSVSPPALGLNKVAQNLPWLVNQVGGAEVAVTEGELEAAADKLMEAAKWKPEQVPISDIAPSADINVPSANGMIGFVGSPGAAEDLRLVRMADGKLVALAQADNSLLAANKLLNKQKVRAVIVDYEKVLAAKVPPPIKAVNNLVTAYGEKIPYVGAEVGYIGLATPEMTAAVDAASAFMEEGVPAGKVMSVEELIVQGQGKEVDAAQLKALVQSYLDGKPLPQPLVVLFDGKPLAVTNGLSVAAARVLGLPKMQVEVVTQLDWKPFLPKKQKTLEEVKAALASKSNAGVFSIAPYSTDAPGFQPVLNTIGVSGVDNAAKISAGAVKQMVKVSDVTFTTNQLATNKIMSFVSPDGSLTSGGSPTLVKYKGKLYGFAMQGKLVAAELAEIPEIECLIVDADKLIAAPKPVASPVTAAPKAPPAQAGQNLPTYAPPRNNKEGRMAVAPPGAAKAGPGLKVKDLPVGDVPGGKVKPYPLSYATALDNVAGLTSAERDAISRFGGSAYSDIRRAERAAPGTANPMYQKLSDNIKSGLGKAKHKPCVAYRGISNVSTADVEKMIASEDLSLGGTSSCAWNADFTQSWCGANSGGDRVVFYVLNQSSGVLVDSPGVVSHREYEIMMPRDVKFKITGVTRAPNGAVTIYADEVGLDLETSKVPVPTGTPAKAPKAKAPKKTAKAQGELP